MLLDFHKHRKQMVEEEEANLVSKWVLTKCGRGILGSFPWTCKLHEKISGYFVAWMNSVFLIIFHGYLRCRLWISSTAKSWRTTGQGPRTQTLWSLSCTTTTVLIVVLLIGFFAFRSCSTEESWNKRKCTGKLVKIKINCCKNDSWKTYWVVCAFFGSYFRIHYLLSENLLFCFLYTCVDCVINLRLNLKVKVYAGFI